MSTETNKTTSRRFHEAFDKGDWAAMRSMLAPNIAAYNTGVETSQNAEQFEAMGRGFFGAFSQSRHVIADQIAEGDKVATRIEWSAIHTGPFNGIPASHRPVKMEVMVFDRYENGRIAEHRAVFDVMGLLVQLGAVPAAA